MKKNLHILVRTCLCLGAFLLVNPRLHGQVFNPNLFDISITFGCNCTCFCDTNSPDTNNPVGMFLAANPVTAIASTAIMPSSGQVLPPHWTELMPIGAIPPDYGEIDGNFIGPSPSLGVAPEPLGWTYIKSSAVPFGYTPFEPVTFNFGYPLEFEKLDYFFYADALPSNPASNASGQSIQKSQSLFQPYPWDVNLTLQLQNGQLYYMEQNLAVGYAPEYFGQAIEPLVNYIETNALLSVSLYCTNGGVTNIMQVSGANITATLLPDNIPTVPDQNSGFTYTPDLFTNWTWPFTPLGATPPFDPNSPPGSAGTVQASLNVGAVSLDDVNLLVRANRAYRLDLTYYLDGYHIETLTVTNTGIVPPCTNLSFSFYSDICSINITNPPPPPMCWSTNIGLVEMMGVPNDPPGITVWAHGDYNTFNANLTGSALSPLPAPFTLPVFMVNETNADFEKWATESLGQYTSYEYFRSPSVNPVLEQCSSITDMGNDLVMCPDSPAVVQGTITLNGCVDTNYYGGQPALSFLQFAQYDSSGLPLDLGGAVPDPSLQNSTSIQATNGASANSPFNLGSGFAITEFNNPGAFSPFNTYMGQYSMQLAGLQSQPCNWDVNDIHLVFGSPVNLDYHVIETGSSFTNLNVSCGTVITNDIGLCFGLATISEINVRENELNGIPPGSIYSSISIHVTGTGPGYTVGPFEFNKVSFQTQFQFNNEVQVPLFLPEGTYQYTRTVVTAGGSYLFLGTNYFTVTCCSNSCLQVDCSTNMVIPSCTNVQVFYNDPTVTDLCCTNWNVFYFPTNGSYFAPGTTNTVTCFVADGCGNSNSCNFSVTVVCQTNSTSPIHISTGGGSVILTSPISPDLPYIFTGNSWSGAGGSWVLQGTTNLSSPNWTTITDAIPIVGYSVTNAGPASFYRWQFQTNQ